MAGLAGLAVAVVTLELVVLETRPQFFRRKVVMAVMVLAPLEQA